MWRNRLSPCTAFAMKKILWICIPLEIVLSIIIIIIIIIYSCFACDDWIVYINKVNLSFQVYIYEIITWGIDNEIWNYPNFISILTKHITFQYLYEKTILYTPLLTKINLLCIIVSIKYIIQCFFFCKWKYLHL